MKRFAAWLSALLMSTCSHPVPAVEVIDCQQYAAAFYQIAAARDAGIPKVEQLKMTTNPGVWRVIEAVYAQPYPPQVWMAYALGFCHAMNTKPPQGGGA